MWGRGSAIGLRKRWIGGRRPALHLYGLGWHRSCGSRRGRCLCTGLRIRRMNRDRNMARTARRQQGTRQLPRNKLSSDQSHYLYLRKGRAGRQQRLHLCTATRRSARGQPFDRGARRVRLLAHVRTWARRLRKRRQQSVPPASSCSSDISPADLAALSRRICAAIPVPPPAGGSEDSAAPMPMTWRSWSQDVTTL